MRNGTILTFKRVAISANYNGGDYPYGGHTERRDYDDIDVGYATTKEEAKKLLTVAWQECEKQNKNY